MPTAFMPGEPAYGAGNASDPRAGELQFAGSVPLSATSFRVASFRRIGRDRESRTVRMTYFLPKLLACLVVALGSVGVLFVLWGRRDEILWLRRLSILTLILSAAASIIVYLVFPEFVRFSDVMNFYLPETEALLAGGLPYRDFPTSYSPLFHAILAVPVMLWHSPGVIVLVMIAAEAITVALYLRVCRRVGRELVGWRTAWIFVSSPTILYWVVLGGYNSILIAMFSMMALSACHYRRETIAGSCASMGLLGCKLLGVLSWPTVVLYRREGALRRLVPMGIALCFLGVLFLAGVDVLQPIRREGGGWSDGNVWFVLATFVPRIFEAAPFEIASVLCFVVFYAAGTLRLIRSTGAADSEQQRWDRSMAHLAWAMAGLLLFSKKSMAMYPPMALPFFAHACLVGRQDRTLVSLLPFLGLGAAATLFPHQGWLRAWIHERPYLHGSTMAQIVLLAQFVKVGAFAYIAVASWRLLGKRSNGQERTR